MVKDIADHQPAVLFTIDNIDADKPISVVILPTVMFIGGPTIQVREGSIQGYW